MCVLMNPEPKMCSMFCLNRNVFSMLSLFKDVSEVPGFSNTHRSIPPRLLVRTQTQSLAVKVNQLNRCLLLLSVCNRLYDSHF